MKLLFLWAALCLAQSVMAPSVAADDTHGHDDHGGHDDHHPHTRISESFADEAGVIVETAGPRRLQITERLYGIIEPHQERIARVRATYPGEIVELNASIGDRVSQGSVLARMKSRETLAPYVVKAPISAVVTERHLNVGELADAEPILELTDLSDVWLELLAYPEQNSLVELGQRVAVRDTTGDVVGETRIDYRAPHRQRDNQGTLIRATLTNEDGRWSPGMMVIGDVTIEAREVPVAVNRSSLQTMDGDTVVFVREGDRYEVRRVELGEGDRDYVEVVDGLESGADYVAENSYLIKADILKSGASHNH